MCVCMFVCVLVCYRNQNFKRLILQPLGIKYLFLSFLFHFCSFHHLLLSFFDNYSFLSFHAKQGNKTAMAQEGLEHEKNIRNKKKVIIIKE